MNRDKKYPKFIQYAKQVDVTKNGKERPYLDIKKDRNKVKEKIDASIVCPMNWLEECLDKIQGASKSRITETHEFLTDRPPGTAKATQMSKIRKIVEEYDAFVKLFVPTISSDNEFYEVDISPWISKTEEVLQQISAMKLSQITVYRLIQTSLGIDGRVNKDKKYRQASKYTRKMLTVLYRTNKEKFLKCFKNNADLV